jgi:hypothetical protein
MSGRPDVLVPAVAVRCNCGCGFAPDGSWSVRCERASAGDAAVQVAHHDELVLELAKVITNFRTTLLRGRTPKVRPTTTGNGEP